MKTEVFETVAKNGPPLSVGVLTWIGLSLETWIQLLTVLWLMILIVGKAWDFGVWLRNRRKGGCQ